MQAALSVKTTKETEGKHNYINKGNDNKNNNDNDNVNNTQDSPRYALQLCI